ASAHAAATPTPPPVRREFRGVWIATAGNIDWPSRPGLSTAEQQAQLLAMLDRARALHLNAVIFQVRPSGDAMYASKLEPWSAFLTGRMGRAPDPPWDPLAFAVKAAHARGLALHAWFNPFRARYPGDTAPAARTHVSRREPGAVHRYGPYLWMDPGSAAARARAIRVILDVVRRYDIDGVHIDDTFYPYPVVRDGREVPFPDDATWRAYRARGGRLTRGAWRRGNVDRFVQALYAAVKREKPWVAVGISPFGIWRPGNPPGIEGFDAYAELNTDSRLWLANGWVDYLAPQLYWPAGHPAQSYAALLKWWVEQNPRGRNIFAGNYAARVAGTAGGSEVWPASEIVNQVALTRQQPGAGGDIFFSMSSLMSDPDSLDEQLLAGPYAARALGPAYPWLDATKPAAPAVTLAPATVGDAPTVRFRPAGPVAPRQWVVQTMTDGAWRTAILPGTARTFTPSDSGNPQAVSVIAVDRAGVESAPTVVVPLDRRNPPRRERRRPDLP
ncbi:MAG: family 10 glycosylhydrolase, partial [Gemmatimonadota bacterium]|nr:family 10 glycosylhydrolase [Gemmatimonadota bacterium]